MHDMTEDMHLEIVPYVGDKVIEPDQIIVKITTPEFTLAARKLVTEAKQKVPEFIADDQTLSVVNDVQSRILAALSQIEAARKLAKAPILALGNAIDNAAKSMTEELTAQKERIKGVHQIYTAEVEAKREAIKRAAHEEKRRKEAELAKQVLELELAKQRAEIEARNATELAEQAMARANAEDLAEKIGDKAFHLAMTKLEPVVEPKFVGPLVRGATTTKDIEVWISDETLLLNQPPATIQQVALVSIKKQATKELVSLVIRQHQNDPDFDVVSYFSDIGIGVRIFTDTKVKAAAKFV